MSKCDIHGEVGVKLGEICPDCAVETVKKIAKYPRAAKLIMNNEEFIIVKCSETYAWVVMNIIRQNELQKGTWTDDDQAWMDEHIDSNYPKDVSGPQMLSFTLDYGKPWPGLGKVYTGEMECTSCHKMKHVNHFHDPDICNECYGSKSNDIWLYPPAGYRLVPYEERVTKLPPDLSHLLSCYRDNDIEKFGGWRGWAGGDLEEADLSHWFINGGYEFAVADGVILGQLETINPSKTRT